MTLIRLRIVIIDVDDAKIRNIEKKDPIRLCATLTAKLPTTAFKSKMISFKLDEDPLQRRIYFLTFIDSLNMVFHNIEKLMKYSEIIQNWRGEIKKNIQKWPLETFCMQIVVYTAGD